MHYAANHCRRKYFKKHTLMVTFTLIMDKIRLWRLQRRMIENVPRNGQQQTLCFYAVQSSFHVDTVQARTSIKVCLRVIVTAKREMRIELRSQSRAKLAYKHDLATDIIDIKYAHLSGSTTLSDKILRDDLIDNKIHSMNESTARHNIFTLLKFDIKGFINPSSNKRRALTRIDITKNDVVPWLTNTGELEDHLLLRNPKAYWASGSTPFGYTALGRLLGNTSDPPSQSPFSMDL
jgi:hypothetical protein